MSVNRHIVDWRAASPRGSDKTEGGVTNYVYTIKQEPTAGDSAYGPNPDSGTDNIFQLLRYDIDSASLVTITIDGKTYSRAVAANITF